MDKISTMDESRIVWNELTPTQQAVLWTMAWYETEISAKVRTPRYYEATKLYHFSKKFYRMDEGEFYRMLYGLALETDLVEANTDGEIMTPDNAEVALRVPCDVILQQNTGAPYTILNELAEAYNKIQDWSSADITAMPVNELADIWSYLDEHINLGLDFCNLPPTKEYGEKLVNLLDSIREQTWDLRRKIVEDGRLPENE